MRMLHFQSFSWQVYATEPLDVECMCDETNSLADMTIRRKCCQKAFSCICTAHPCSASCTATTCASMQLPAAAEDWRPFGSGRTGRTFL
mmetsp:Transcript_55773/g.130766  ORF Transcript_55773/g.130766 Transcript_55773/m.130766 type:complete len:89 (+) Transcript_55773:1337-1603(+)